MKILFLAGPPGETPEEREQRHALNKEKAAMLKRQAEPRHRWENSKFTLTNTDDERLPPYRTYPCMQTVYLCILTVAVVLVLL